MKKTCLLNSDISMVVASMGHLDMLAIGDAGLPTPSGVRQIDLAVREGVPGFLETVDAIASELQIESIIVARETCEKSPQIAEGLKRLFGNVPWQMVSHDELKEKTHFVKAVIRTGEFTSFANVVLVSGVVFGK